MDLLSPSSKFTPPDLTSRHCPKIVARPRLIQKLKQNASKKIIFLIGQAAQGKSTLAADYVRKSRKRTIWINLNSAEGDTANLCHVFLEALKTLAIPADHQNWLHSISNWIGLKRNQALLAEWAHDLIPAKTEPMLIVLDGLEKIPAGAPSLELLQRIVIDSPPQVQFLVLSRNHPPFNVQRLKLKRQVLIVDNTELALTLEESRTFLNQDLPNAYSPEKSAEIHTKTEGWIGGLILVTEMYNRFPTQNGEVDLHQHPDHRLPEDIFNYFSEEIFATLPKPTQSLLIRSSVFDHVDTDLVNTCLGRKDAQTIFYNLAQNNFFTQSLVNANNRIVYRFHQLFKEFLQYKCQTVLTQEDRRWLFMAAATTYERRNELENAVHFYLHAEAPKLAVKVIERVGLSLLSMGRGADLESWLQKLPVAQIEQSPWLLFMKAKTRRFADVKNRVACLHDACTLFQKQNNHTGRMLALANLIEYSFQGGYFKVPVEKLLKQAEALLARPSKEEQTNETAVLWLQVGLGHIRGTGDVRAGLRACRTAFVLGQHLRDRDIQAKALVYCVFGHTFLGEFREAADLFDRIDDLLDANDPEIKAGYLLSISSFHIYSGNFKQADAYIMELEELIEAYGYNSLQPSVFYFKNILRLSVGKLDAVKTSAEQLLDLTDSVRNHFLKGLGWGLLGKYHYFNADFDTAIHYMEKSIAFLADQKGASKHHFLRAKGVLGLLYCHCKKFQTAQKQLTEALAYFKAIESHLSLAEMHLALGLLEFARDNQPEAKSQLARGIVIFKQRAYIHNLILSPADFVGACALAAELKVKGAVQFIDSILVQNNSPAIKGELSRLESHPSRCIQKVARIIKKQITRRRLSSLEVRTLGGFRIIKDGRAMAPKSLNRRKPFRLLKVIVARGGIQIPKELIFEDLWPKSSLATAEKVFKVTLHRLRAALEKDLKHKTSASYITLKDNLISLDPHHLQVDCDHFEELCRQAENKLRQRRKREAIVYYEQARDLYEGDFLPEERYAEWVKTRREKLKQKHRQLHLALADIHLSNNAVNRAIWCYQTLMQIDPSFENSYRELIRLYLDQQRPNEALWVFRACQKALRKTISSPPDEATRALVQHLL